MPRDMKLVEDYNRLLALVRDRVGHRANEPLLDGAPLVLHHDLHPTDPRDNQDRPLPGHAAHH